MDNKNKLKNRDYFLWERFRNGDKDALSHIYKSNYSFLYDYGYRFLGNHNIVRECIQGLFFNLISHIDSLSTPRNIRSSLLASLREMIFDRLNQNNYNSFTEGNSEYSFELVNTHGDFLADKEKEPMKKLDFQVNINNLSAREKELIYLKFSKNMSYEEITEIMGIDYDSIRKLIEKAIKDIRNLSRTRISEHN